MLVQKEIDMDFDSDDGDVSTTTTTTTNTEPGGFHSAAVANVDDDAVRRRASLIKVKNVEILESFRLVCEAPLR